MSNPNSFRIAWSNGEKTLEEKPHLKYVLTAMKNNFNPALKGVKVSQEADKTAISAGKSNNTNNVKTISDSKSTKKNTTCVVTESHGDQKSGKKSNSLTDCSLEKKSNLVLSKSCLSEGLEEISNDVKKISVVSKSNMDSILDVHSLKKEPPMVKNTTSELVIDKKNFGKKDLTTNKTVVKTCEVGNIIKAEASKKKTEKNAEIGGVDFETATNKIDGVLQTSELVDKDDQNDLKQSNAVKVTSAVDTPPCQSTVDNGDIEERKKRRKRTQRKRSLSRSEGGSEGDSPFNGPKRSARRWSKEGESVLQNAIARKEKSLSSIGKKDDDKSLKSAAVRNLRENRNSFPLGKRSLAKSQDSASVNSDSSSDSKVKSSSMPKSSSSDSLSDIFKGSKEMRDIKNSSDTKGEKVGVNSESSFETPKVSPTKQETEVACTYTKTGKRRYKPFRGLRYSFSGVTKKTKVMRRSIPAHSSISSEYTPKKVNSNLNSKTQTGSATLKRINGTVADKSRSNSPAVADACTSKAKKSRREDPQSPSPSPGDTPADANQPESTAISFGAGTAGLCLCQSKTSLYVRKDAFEENDVSLMCQAVDSLEGRLIGCCNAVGGTESARLYRPSPRVPYVVVCEQHRQRLLRHHCCPGCGHYCTQGRFVQCPALHYYHRDCQLLISGKPQCPHCGLESPRDEVSISLGVKKYPVFLPHQKLVKQTPSARMSLGSNLTTMEPPQSPPVSIAMTLPIATTVLDKGEREKLEKIFNGACSVRSEGRSAHAPRYSAKHLYQAAKAGDSEKIISIIRHGINSNHIFREINMRTALHAASEKGHVLAVHVLVQAGAQLDPQDSDLMTPLMYASLHNHTRIVQYLVKAGARVTHQGSDGMTALHIAAKQGSLDNCHCLLTHGKAPLSFIDVKDDGGWTALVWSCEFRHVTVARYLLEKRADPLLRDSEHNTALHWAAFSGSEEISEKLLNNGCDVNGLNMHGDTPLHVAARQGNLQCVLLFLSRGAKPDLLNVSSQLALDCAAEGSDCFNAINTTAELRKMTKSAKERTNKILTNDMTHGKEECEIQCLNAVDEEAAPRDYVYVTKNCFTSNIHVDKTITSLQSCECEDACIGTSCKCTQLSLQSWYDTEGKLLPEFNFFDPPMLFECNELCSCNVKLCRNRVVQRGFKARFQLFRTVGKGWGVRTLTLIPKGTYVCEYIGEIISDCEADQREDDSYLFDLDNRDGETYCIDACRYGNIARFINHMCAPNLQPVRVFMGHHDLHFPRIAFFANRDIQPQEELGFDYGDKFWIIKYKSFTCTCGAPSCKYSETSIKQTLLEYNRKQEEETTL